MGSISHEGKVPMPVGQWEPSRQLGHEGEVRHDVPSNWLPANLSPQPEGAGSESPVDQPEEVAQASLGRGRPQVDRPREREDDVVPARDGVEFEGRTYRLGGHNGTLSEEEHKEVLRVVARSIVRSLTEEAQRVRDTYAMQQLPRPRSVEVQPLGSEGFQDVQGVP